MNKLFFFFYLSFYSVQSQNNSKFFAESIEWNIAENLITKDSIYALDIGFQNNISDFYFDTANEILISYFSLLDVEGGKSDFDIISAYSINDRKPLWHKFVNRKKQKYHVSGSNLFLNDIKKGEAKRLNIFNHKELWTAKTFLYHLPDDNYSKSLILGTTYEVLSGPIEVQGIDPLNGNIKWSNRNIEIKKNKVEQAYIQDSMLIIINEKLYAVNLYTGMSWEYDYVFNIPSAKDKTDLRNLYNGGLIDAFMFRLFDNGRSFSNLDYVKRCSNIVSETNCFFLGSDKALLKFDYSGNLLLESNYPKNLKSGNAKLFKFLDDYYLLNLNIESGFLNHYDGEGNFIGYFKNSTHLNMRDRTILDYTILENKIVLLEDSYIVLLDSLLKVSQHKKFKIKESRQWSEILKKPFYFRRNDSFDLHINLDGKDIFILQNDKSIQKLNSNLEIVTLYDRVNVFYEEYDDGRLQILKNENDDAYFMDKKLNKVALKINGLRKIIEHKNKIYIAALNGFYVIDKDEFF